MVTNTKVFDLATLLNPKICVCDHSSLAHFVSHFLCQQKTYNKSKLP